METITMDAQRRGLYTKSEIKQARRRGRVPGAVYGRGVEPFLVEVSAREIVKVLGSEGGLNAMIDLGIEGEPKRTVMIGELERDAITRGFLHVGFHHVSSTERVHTQIPVRFVGEPDSVRTKEAMLEQLVETVEIKALPGDVPAHIDIDVSQLKVGDKLHISDLAHDSKIEFLSPEETAIASLHLVYGASGDATDAAEAPAAEAIEPAAS